MDVNDGIRIGHTQHKQLPTNLCRRDVFEIPGRSPTQQSWVPRRSVRLSNDHRIAYDRSRHHRVINGDRAVRLMGMALVVIEPTSHSLD
jgi:hypothetical protein